MPQNKIKTPLIILSVFLFCLVIFGIIIYFRRAGHVVIDPESGQKVLTNELTILGSGEDIGSLIKPYRGEITASIKETDTYQIRFPVSNLDQLKVIQSKLRQKGLTVYLSLILDFP